jgi:hypothetical protein
MFIGYLITLFEQKIKRLKLFFYILLIKKFLNLIKKLNSYFKINE